MPLLKPSMDTRPVILQNDVPLRGCGCTIESFKAIILKLGFESWSYRICRIQSSREANGQAFCSISMQAGSKRNAIIFYWNLWIEIIQLINLVSFWFPTIYQWFWGRKICYQKQGKWRSQEACWNRKNKKPDNNFPE